MNQKPKLLLVADTYYPKVDGTLRFMEEFTRRAREFEVSLLVPKLGRKKESILAKKVEKTTYIDPSKRIAVSGYPTMQLSFKNLRKIKKAIKDNDIIFVQGPALISYLGIFYGRRFKKKTFFYTHTIAWELFEKFFPPLLNRLFFNLIKKMSILFYNRCDEVLVPYHELGQHLKKEGVRSTITVAKLGVDIARFSPAKDKRLSKGKLDIAPLGTVIGYLGRISKEKNTQILLEAFEKLKNQKDLTLLMVGDGPTEQTEEFRKVKNCKVTGFVQDVHNYLKAMDIFVMPSLTETTSLSTLEAMSCGIPPIVTKVGFMKNYVVKDHNGMFFPRNKAGLLALKIEKLRADSVLRRRLGRNARKTVAYSFSWERSINKIKRLLMQKYF